MKIISKEEEAAHYSQVLKGGAIGGTAAGLGSLAGVLLASRRYTAFRQLTIPFRTFLVTSGATFGAITTAERYSLAFQKAKDPMNFYQDDASRALQQARDAQGAKGKFMDWGRENRYTIVFTSWIAAMAIALGIVGRNKYISTSQKLVQARVYAQGLTLAVLIATAAFETSDAKEGRGRWETVMVLDPEDPTHQHLIEKKVHKEEYEGQDLWKDMVAAEERRLQAKKPEKKAKKGSAPSAKPEEDVKVSKDVKAEEDKAEDNKAEQATPAAS